jgi:hypothetical protein
MRPASWSVLVVLLAATPAVAAGGGGNPFATAGWTGHGYVSSSFGDEAGEIWQARIGAQRHWASGLALEMGGSFGVFDADSADGEPAEDGGVVGFDLLLRWYFHRAERWAIFADAGGGALWFEDEFPVHDGTSFNFQPQAGVGMVHQVGQDVWLLWGARWHHVSNGNVFGKEENRGYDAAMPYFGVIWRP